LNYIGLQASTLAARHQLCYINVRYLLTYLTYTLGSVDKVVHLCAASLDSTSAGTDMSHWWGQEGHPAKVAPVHH